VTVLEVAALIDSSRLLISNDTGPMHFGPAVGVLTLGLFSVGYPEHFRPAGPNDRFLRANPIEKIQVSDVIETVEQMWATADPDLRR
jgi:ADP-heptose:LPS heptosyltransferase